MSFDVSKFDESVVVDELLDSVRCRDVEDFVPAERLGPLLDVLQENMHVHGVPGVLGGKSSDGCVVDFHPFARSIVEDAYLGLSWCPGEWWDDRGCWDCPRKWYCGNGCSSSAFSCDSSVDDGLDFGGVHDDCWC